MTTGASGGAGAAGEAASARACTVQGWSVVDALPEDCRGVCQPDSLTSRLPILAWNPRADWCAGCFALDTPWATSDAQRQNAVDGYLVATGAGPDLVEIGMLTNAVDGIIGLYDGQLQPHAAFYGLDDSPCGRVASLRFSHDGMLGVHLMQTVGKEQFLYETSPQSASALFEPQNRAFTWPTSIVGQLAINDMWFSSQRQAIDLTGSLWVADLSAQSAQQVSKVPGAPAGEYSSAEVAGADVFVSRWVQGASDWWVYHPAGLTRLLGGAGLDVRQMVTDGKTIVWLEGSNPVPPEAGVGPMVFSHYALYRSAYTLDPSKIQRELVADNVPTSLSHLVMANGYVLGVYLIAQPAYRSAALVVRLADHQQMRSTVPNGYSWGYQLYPTPTEIWGPVTPGPMISFETIARFPYTVLDSL